MSRRGFSLAETILGFALVSLIVVLVVNLVPTAMTTIRSAEHRYRAETLAASILEEKSDVAFQELPIGLDQDLGRHTYDQVDYHIRFQVHPCGGDPRYLRALRVLVQWKFKKRQRQIEVEVLSHRLPTP